jgi:hypothetical protein
MSEMMYQQVHQQATPMHYVRPELPEALDNIVNTALSKDPAHRFRSTLAFARMFENVVTKRVGNPLPSITR